MPFEPKNINFQSPLNFEVRIMRLPDVIFNLQEVNIPGLELGVADQLTNLNKIPHPGDEIKYGPFEFTFKVQEGFRDWYSIWTWIIDLGFPQSPEQYARLREGREKNLDGNPIPFASGRPASYMSHLFTDITLLVLTSKENPYLEITLKDAFPISLSPLTLKTTEDDIKYLTAATRFAYSYYEVKKTT